MEELGVAELGGLDGDIARSVFGSEADHDTRGERPWLAAGVLDIGNFEIGLLSDLASDALLERLIGLEETCYEAVVVTAEILCLDE